MYTKAELLKFYNMELNSLLKEAQKYLKNEFEFCSIISARTGKCSQNCRYCAQSSHYNTEIETHPLLEVQTVVDAAKDSVKNSADRVAIVTSGKTPDESDFDRMLEMIKALNAEGIKSCASIGILNEEQAKLLAQNGLVRFHHNINTCKSYHPQICTTHTYEDRINTVKLVQKYGIELCCGVIIGMGETIEQRIEMAMELAEINPESIPVNILTPIPNTPFESYIDKIDEENVLRTLAVFKIACPNSSIRLAGGKKSRLSLESIEKAFSHCVDSTIVGNYLTTTGFTPSEDVKLIQKVGRKITNLQLV
ncbi:MAG: biotin synthase BioB [Cyanobacteria bacterium SIG28]|nr:biotin synthase BioB [Cyanobacteria bacterium SIG28]